MQDDLDKIHHTLRITTDITQILRAVEKYFGGEANYAKGKGAMYMDWMRRYHPGAYLYGVSRACGGSRQDLGVEGAVAVLMNTPFYLEFLVWRQRCGNHDGILERNLYMILRSVEMQSYLRVNSILHISMCMPLRWLAGNCGDLEQYNFGVAEMAEVVDIMDKACHKIVIDGGMILDEDFMMSIFDKLINQIQPFKDYLTYMFKEKLSLLVGSKKEEDKVLPWDLLRSELFYPTRVDLIQTNEYASELGAEAAAIFRTEFRDESKATHKYLSEIEKRIRSIEKITNEERLAGRGVAASNCISESGHARATDDLVTFGTIDLQNCGARGMSVANNDFGREADTMVGSRQSRKGKIARGMGKFHLMVQELQHSAIMTAKRKRNRHKRQFQIDLKKQFETKRRKEEIALEKKIELAREDYIDALYLFEQYHSPRRWKTEAEAVSIYNQLKSESARKAAVKVRISICLFHLLISQN